MRAAYNVSLGTSQRELNPDQHLAYQSGALIVDWVSSLSIAAVSRFTALREAPSTPDRNSCL